MRRNWPIINYLDKLTGILTDSAIAVAVADLAVFKNGLHHFLLFFRKRNWYG